MNILERIDQSLERAKWKESGWEKGTSLETLKGLDSLGGKIK